MDPLRIYHKMPVPLRSFVATLRGLYLRSWRYGRETDQLVQEALERERWSTDAWKNWQQKELAILLHRAATRVPFYREMWAVRRRNGDNASWENLENWPVLEKKSIRENPISFVADDCKTRRMFESHTSGTTGTAIRLFWSRKNLRRWYALFEARCRLWYNVSREDRWALIGGQLVTSATQRKPPFWVWNSALHQLYMSSYHLAPDLIPFYLEALEKYKVKYLLGYTSSLYSIALEVLRLGMRTPKMSVCITNAEPTHEYQRHAIAEAFQCPVRETYGMAEVVSAASECEFGTLHSWPDAGMLETFEGPEVVKDQPGDFVCTGLLNTDMPLIRYRVGDRGFAVSSDSSCQCGRSLPRLDPIEGRIDDVLYTFDGRRIGRLDPIFKTNLPIREAQIIQEALDRVRVRYVPEPHFTAQSGESITKRLQARMGAVQVILEPMNEIPRTANGKFRAVISLITIPDTK